MLLKSWYGILVILNIEKPCAETEVMTLLFTMKARFETSYIDAAIRSKRGHCTKNFSDPVVVSIDRPVRLKRRHCIPLKLSTWHERHDIGWNNDTKLGQIP